MSLGHSIVYALTIPPKQSYWKVSGHCSEECTAKTIPAEGIKIFNIFLHGHYLGKIIKL